MHFSRERSITIGVLSLAAALVGSLGGREVSGAVVPPAGVEPNDPWYGEEVAIYTTADGAVPLRRQSNRQERDTVQVNPAALLDAPGAWAYTTGSARVVVAILDDGFFYRHEDLAGNIWRNPGESGIDEHGIDRAVNGKDDDGNGYVDDVIGWDFAFDDADPDAYGFDGMDRSRVQPYWHSLSALGIIGARGNNGIGVAGINWRVSMMLLRIGAQGTPRRAIDTARAAHAARAIRYAADNGARIINWSGYVSDRRPEALADLRNAVEYAAHKGVLLVTGAGNDRRDLDDDKNCLYPQCFDLPNQLLVAELNFTGALLEYKVGDQLRGSNFGKRRVSVGAIAEVFTTGLANGESIYWRQGGTSNAGPVVTGVAALLLSVRPDLSPVELKRILVQSATPITALDGKVSSGGAISAGRALRLACGGATPPRCDPPPTARTAGTVLQPGLPTASSALELPAAIEESRCRTRSYGFASILGGTPCQS